MIIDKVSEYQKTEHEFPGLFTVNFKSDPFLCLDDKSNYLGGFQKCLRETHSSHWLKQICKPFKFLKCIGKIERQFRYVICQMKKSNELILVKNIQWTYSLEK